MMLHNPRVCSHDCFVKVRVRFGSSSFFLKMILGCLLLIVTSPKIISTASEVETDVELQVELWNEQAVVVKEDNTNGPPRYLVGQVSSLSSKEKCFSHFTFDLGNPGDTTFLVDHCRGCNTEKSIPKNDDNTTACPLELPDCVSPTSNYCWPSRPQESLTWDCFQHTPPEQMILECDSRIKADNVICMMCFDNGNHSRYYLPSQVNPKQPLGFLKSDDTSYYALPETFQFGALIRTIPLQDRIWSNVGIGYNSSFMRQSKFTSFQFSFQKKDDLKIIFNPSLLRNKSLLQYQQSYSTPHQRIHHISGFQLGNSNTMLHGSTNKSENTEVITPMEFFMDTGNGGIFLADPVFRQNLAHATGGYWTQDENGVASDTQRLMIPTPLKAPELKIVFAPNIQVTMKGYQWVLPSDESDTTMSKTIFTSTSYNYSILGLPFISSGVDLIFDDEKKILHLMGENVQTIPTRTKLDVFESTESKKAVLRGL